MRHILKIHRDLSGPLTAPGFSYTITTFDPHTHKEQWLDLNNKIFAGHPDQGNWALADLENRMVESWFDPQGFFLALDGEKIIGTVWTKIHRDYVNQEPVGELYVVGTDPDYSGKGIARVLSITALNYLMSKGLTRSMLYVDADNEKGLSLYQSLGFN
jgi:mycothiol synthase